MSLVWKLLRQHISLPQLAGFFFANLCGMVIVLLSVQFYKDILPVLRSEKVRNVIGKVPPRLVSLGTVVITRIVLALAASTLLSPGT